MNLTVKQKQSQNGFLGGPKMAKLLFDKNNIEYEIYIEQCGIRTITIKSNSEIVYEDLLEVYYSLEQSASSRNIFERPQDRLLRLR